ncbi:RNA polymerase sigma-70 factor [Chitinophaga sp. XS-30]|uniref:RNA polymerase sigma-70 factor n=1 Tax=Chitinophaga sp. XS-30 TaxID=2604421 RepID=UPI001AF00C93|nr:RNA polymerase sigma-70 factor [Chitinophaga sp. XS-30]
MAKTVSGYTFSDKELISLLVAGREEAFTEIYHRYWEKLFTIAYNLTRDQVLAEEITQEVFISLWDRKGDVRIDTLNGYLATAIKFSVFKHIRRQRRRLEIVKDNYHKWSVNDEEEKIYARFLKEYVEGIVEQLPEKCRLVFEYSRREGLTIPEIAAKMNISPKTAEAHLTKALKTIRINLKHSAPMLLLLISQQ